MNGCTGLTPGYVATGVWTFTPGIAPDVIANTAGSPAANVGIQLLDASYKPIATGASTVLATITAAGAYSTTFYAQYFGAGSAGAGNVTALATFNINYN